MALSYHHRFLNKLRSLLSILLTSYDPFGDKLLEHFRVNPYYPFTHTQSFTFEYKYRRWSTIYFLLVIQLIIFTISLYSYCHFHINEYWISGSDFLLLATFAMITICLSLNIIENLKQRRIVLSPLDFHVSIYINHTLQQRYSIDRAYICLHKIESYNILLYHLVFIIEDIDFIKISDYFHYQSQLRQIGKCLAQNLFISYIESEHWIGIFPKYKKLKNYLHKQNNNSSSTRNVRSYTIINL